MKSIRYALLLLPLLAPAAFAGEFKFRAAALTGSHPAGMPADAEFTSFEAPALNNSGQVAFFATMKPFIGGTTTFNNSGIWSEGGGGLHMVVRSGTQPPGTTTGTIIYNLHTPAFNNQGQTAFNANVAHLIDSVDGTNDTGLWSEGNGALALVAREGDSAPGAPPGSVFGHFSPDTTPAFNDAGQTAFTSMLQVNPVSGAYQEDKQSVWSEADGSLTLVARVGGQVPGAAPGATFVSNTFSTPQLSADGGVAFRAMLQQGIGGVTAANDSGVWSQKNGPLAIVAREGSPAPGTPSGVNFGSFQFVEPVANNQGQTLFLGELVQGGGVTFDNVFGLWSDTSGPLALVLRKPNEMPGTPAGIKWDFAIQPVLNNNGKSGFLAILDVGSGGVTTSNDVALMTENNGTFEIVAREGSQAPGAPAGAIFTNFGPPSLNTPGSMTFIGTLLQGVGGVTASNNRGIWAQDSNGVLKLIVRTGDLLEVAPNDFRTVSFLNGIDYSGNGDGKRSSFNDAGQVAFLARFTDNSQGVFVATLVPEPSSSVLALVGIFGFTLRRKRST